MKEKWMSDESIEAVSLTYLFAGRAAAKTHVDRLADEFKKTHRMAGGIHRSDRRALLLEGIRRGTPPPKPPIPIQKIEHPPEVKSLIEKYGLGSQVVELCMKITGCNWR